jgi:hypothetical protein
LNNKFSDVIKIKLIEEIQNKLKFRWLSSRSIIYIAGRDFVENGWVLFFGR